VRRRGVVYKCSAPEELFAANEADIPEEVWAVVDHLPGLPCQGDGIPGPRCAPCPFFEEPDELDERDLAWLENS